MQSLLISSSILRLSTHCLLSLYGFVSFGHCIWNHTIYDRLWLFSLSIKCFPALLRWITTDYYSIYQLEKALVTQSSTLAWKLPWMEEPGRLQSMGSLSWTWLSNFTFTFHFHALEKEMATHSSVLAWRIPRTGKPGGLLCMGSHRVGHDWSDLAAAADFLMMPFWPLWLATSL